MMLRDSVPERFAAAVIACERAQCDEARRKKDEQVDAEALPQVVDMGREMELGLGMPGAKQHIGESEGAEIAAGKSEQPEPLTRRQR